MNNEIKLEADPVRLQASVYDTSRHVAWWLVPGCLQSVGKCPRSIPREMKPARSSNSSCSVLYHVNGVVRLRDDTLHDITGSRGPGRLDIKFVEPMFRAWPSVVYGWPIRSRWVHGPHSLIISELSHRDRIVPNVQTRWLPQLKPVTGSGDWKRGDLVRPLCDASSMAIALRDWFCLPMKIIRSMAPSVLVAHRDQFGHGEKVKQLPMIGITLATHAIGSDHAIQAQALEVSASTRVFANSLVRRGRGATPATWLRVSIAAPKRKQYRQHLM